MVAVGEQSDRRVVAGDPIEAQGSVAPGGLDQPDDGAEGGDRHHPPGQPDPLSAVEIERRHARRRARQQGVEGVQGQVGRKAQGPPAHRPSLVGDRGIGAVSRQSSPDGGRQRDQLQHEQQIGADCGEQQARAAHQRLEVQGPKADQEDGDGREADDRLLVLVEPRGPAGEGQDQGEDRKSEQSPPAPIRRRAQRAPARRNRHDLTAALRPPPHRT